MPGFAFGGVVHKVFFPLFASMMLLFAGYASAHMVLVDDFEHQDGPLGDHWQVEQGTFAVSEKKATGGAYAVAILKGRKSSVIEADVEAAGDGIQYVALLLGYRDINNNYFIKLQDNDGTDRNFDSLYCYYGGNSASFWGSNTMIPLEAPFQRAHMKTRFVHEEREVVITLSNIDGTGNVQEYRCPEAPLSGGEGVGIGFFAMDLGRIDNVAVGTQVEAVPASDAFAHAAFAVLACAASVFFLICKRNLTLH
jgi:hypothetical protein